MSETPAEGIGFVVHDVARMMRWEFDRRASDLKLTRSQWSVLAHLLRNDGIQQRDLAEQMDITAITLTGLLDRMERDGWVERRADPVDRRAKRVYLTEKVAPVTKELRALAREVRKTALQGLSEAEQQTLMNLLQRVRANLSIRG
ncbi:MAG: MarR family winged helix-turn-helix transcriptional regulator [Gammaproteobacteria bacterium]